jgi:hypothetical protein
VCGAACLLASPDPFVPVQFTLTTFWWVRMAFLRVYALTRGVHAGWGVYLPGACGVYWQYRVV